MWRFKHSSLAGEAWLAIAMIAAHHIAEQVRMASGLIKAFTTI